MRRGKSSYEFGGLRDAQSAMPLQAEPLIVVLVMVGKYSHTSEGLLALGQRFQI